MTPTEVKTDKRRRPKIRSRDTESTSIDQCALQWVAKSLDTLVELENSVSREWSGRYPPGMTAYVQRWHEIRFNRSLAVPLLESWSEQMALTFLVDHSPFGTFQVVGSEVEQPPSFTIASQQELFNRLHEERYIKEPLRPKGKYLKYRISHLNTLHAMVGKESPFKSTRLQAALKRSHLHTMAARGDLAGVDRGRMRYLPPSLDEASFQALLRTCSEDPVSIRDKALMYFARQVGIMGSAEVRLLQVEHLRKVAPSVFEIDLSASGIRPLNGRVRALNPLLTGSAFDAMEAWLMILDKVSGPVFSNLGRGYRHAQGKAITVHTIRHMLKVRSKQVAIPIVSFRSLPSNTLADGASDSKKPLTESGREVPNPGLVASIGTATSEIFVVREKVPATFPTFVSAQFAQFVVTGSLGTSPLLEIPGFNSKFELGRIYLDGDLLVEHDSGRAANLSPIGARAITALAAYFGIPRAIDFYRATLEEQLDGFLESPAGSCLREACAEHLDFCSAHQTPLYARALDAGAAGA